jgi:predicted transcriptional regulator
MSNPTAPSDPLLEQTSSIVTAYASTNQLTEDGLVQLIRRVHRELQAVSGAAPVEQPAEEAKPAAPPTPAVPIKKSVMPDYLVCLEDGAKVKVLKRYLRSRFNMSPEEYREKWGLPRDYPMSAPNYSKHRSEMAKRIGLGRKRDAVEESEAAVEEPRRGRRGSRG